jgi:hypothetical protein
MNGLLRPAEFKYDDESRGTLGMRWTCWIRDFQVFMTAAGITKAAQRKATLLHVVSRFCKKRINAIENRHSEEEQENIKDDRSERYLFTIKGNDNHRPITNVQLNGNTIKILIDSGSGSNVIDEATFKSLKNPPERKTAKTKIYAFDSNRAIPVIGEFITWIELEGKSCRDEFLIVTRKST